MAFLVGGANSAVSGVYDVANSCRFNDGDAASMNADVSSTSQDTTGTISFWFKRGVLSTDQRVFINYVDANNYGAIKLQSDNKMEVVVIDGGAVTAKLVTTQVFRDCSSWYHCVVALDSSNGTAGNRMRLYINGTEVTAFDTDTNPDEDATMEHFTDGNRRIGQMNSDQYFDGYLAEFVFIDGTQYAASDFGEFNSDSPTIWQPKDVSGLTFGGKGFYLDFEDSANLGNDKNGGTDFTETNLAATDQATDTPTNNFATANPLANLNGSPTYSQGNLEVTGDSSANHNWQSTIGLSSGKWYWEMKSTASSPDSALIFYDQSIISGNHPGEGFATSARKKIINDSTTGSAIGSTAQNDIHGMALDLDNGKLWIHRNGTYIESGDPAGDANPFIETSDGLESEGVIGGFVYNGTVQLNFGGCPAFAIASGNADDNGYGNFEYDVPAGFYALNTKNLAEYG